MFSAHITGCAREGLNVSLSYNAGTLLFLAAIWDQIFLTK